MEGQTTEAYWNGKPWGYDDERGWGANTNSRSDAYKVFKFAAENSNVEWSYQRYTDGTAAVTTAGQNALTLTGVHMKANKGKTVAADVHSHPNAYEDDLKPSDRDQDRARFFREKNANAKFKLYVPQHPDSKKKMQGI